MGTKLHPLSTSERGTTRHYLPHVGSDDLPCNVELKVGLPRCIVFMKITTRRCEGCTIRNTLSRNRSLQSVLNHAPLTTVERPERSLYFPHFRRPLAGPYRDTSIISAKPLRIYSAALSLCRASCMAYPRLRQPHGSGAPYKCTYHIHRVISYCRATVTISHCPAFRKVPECSWTDNRGIHKPRPRK